ncbi:Catenin alpha-2 [Microtus ochrogaster]|uniref:Catenin alpha-2 n=1 Tax=Microtus ochrogaster TaxID=79684 RepID=A0A8J6G3Q2_MICOH|nr:Catenin alpha-2 [Microtus ochrogaster]
MLKYPKWDDSGNDIIVLAKQMCMVTMDMTTSPEASHSKTHQTAKPSRKTKTNQPTNKKTIRCDRCCQEIRRGGIQVGKAWPNSLRSLPRLRLQAGSAGLPSAHRSLLPPAQHL